MDIFVQNLELSTFYQINCMQNSKLSSSFGTSEEDQDIVPNILEDFQQSNDPVVSMESKVQQTISMLVRVHGELKGILASNNIKEDFITEAFRIGLDVVLNIKNPRLIRVGQQFFSLCEELVIQAKEVSSQKDQCEKKIEIKIPPKKEEKLQTVKQAIKRPIQVKQNKISFAKNEDMIMTQDSQISNPYAKDSFNDQIAQYKQSKFQQQISQLSYPIAWQRKANFLVEDRKITKLHDNNYRKIVSLKPLKGDGIFRFKFRVITMGTVALGIVPQENKNGYFVDDRINDVLKYVAFGNGGSGKIVYNKKELTSGRHLALKEGDQVELVFDSKIMVCTLKTTQMRKSQSIDIRQYKDRNIFLFVEMKQKDTSIEFF